MCADRMTRRSVLEKCLWMMGTASLASEVLTSCNQPVSQATLCDSKKILPAYQASQPPVTLYWINEGVTGDVYSNLINLFQAQYSNISVMSVTNQDHDFILNAMSNSGSQMPDIVSLDVIWINEFAQKKLVVPLCDFWPLNERNRYFSIPMQATTIGGKVYAAPFRMDLGLLFYRTDITLIPPATWQDLVTYATQALANKRTEYGYVWQSDTTINTSRPVYVYGEGLFCDYLEVLYTYGGKIDLNDLSTVKSSQAEQALTEMVSWIGTISPLSSGEYEVSNFDEWSSIGGGSAFMRNWPVYISESNRISQLRGKFAVAPLPRGSAGPGRSCLGGWCLAINAASRPEKQAAAWTFIHWMMQEEAQLYAAKVNAWLTTLMSVYSNPDILSTYSFFGQVRDMLQSAIIRPQAPFYMSVSGLFQNYLQLALLHQQTPKVALSNLYNDLVKLVNTEKQNGLTVENTLTACQSTGQSVFW